MLLKLFGAKIGEGCKINSSFKIWAPWNLEIGNFVAIGFDVFCYNPGKITIGNMCTISQRTHLCSASHDTALASNPLITAPIDLKDRVWVAADAFVGMDVTIGEGAVIGARACVFKDVESWTIVGGNPAKFIKKRELNG
nr:putative colanic acid biosynthesis acetyltransferase [Aquimarina agarivorans]